MYSCRIFKQKVRRRFSTFYCFFIMKRVSNLSRYSSILSNSRYNHFYPKLQYLFNFYRNFSEEKIFVGFKDSTTRLKSQQLIIKTSIYQDQKKKIIMYEKKKSLSLMDILMQLKSFDACFLIFEIRTWKCSSELFSHLV